MVMGDKGLIGVLLLIAILFVPLISATNTIEKHDSQGAAYFTEGYTINVLHSSVMKFETSTIFYASFYDTKGKLQTNATADCLLGILSPGLDRVIIYEEDNMTFLSGDTIQVTFINGSFFSELGEYTFNYNCDDGGGTIGGYFHGRFEVTNNGEKVNGTSWVLIITLLFMSLLLASFTYSFNKEHWIFRTFFSFMALGTAILALNAARALASASMILTRVSSVGLTVSIVVFLILFLYFFVYAFIEVIQMMKEKRGIRWKY